MAQQQLLVVIH